MTGTEAEGLQGSLLEWKMSSTGNWKRENCVIASLRNGK